MIRLHSIYNSIRSSDSNRRAVNLRSESKLNQFAPCVFKKSNITTAEEKFEVKKVFELHFLSTSAQYNRENKYIVLDRKSVV